MRQRPGRELRAHELITYDSHKTLKGEKLGYLSGIMYLSPAGESGQNMCFWSSPLCRRWCLRRAGKMRFDSARKARIDRTRFFLYNRQQFRRRLSSEILAFSRRAQREGFRKVVIRLNGTSDVPWESVYPDLFPEFPMVQFMDYTKSPQRARAFARGEMPDNYHLTFSLSETRESEECALGLLALGVNVAAVFGEPPDLWRDYPVIDGDRNDLRFLDPRPAVVGLSPKGIAAADLVKAGGFIR